MAYVYQEYGISDALSDGWRVFRCRWVLFACSAAIPVVVDHAGRSLSGLPGLWLGSLVDENLGSLGRRLGTVAFALGVLLVRIGISAFVARWALAGMDGDTRPSSAQARDVRGRFWAYAGWSLVVTALGLVGLLACVVGFFAVWFFTLWVPFLVLERRPSPLKGSFEGVREYWHEAGWIFAVLVAAHALGAVLSTVLDSVTFVLPMLASIVVATVGTWAVCCQASIYRASCQVEPNAAWDPSLKREDIVSWAMEGAAVREMTQVPTEGRAAPPPAPQVPPLATGPPVPQGPIPPADTSQPPPSAW
ncbi:MAG: hypothetical protein DYH08_07730 [Actinobacteria bacterium ATB1]|nr:hypothetical protein [Actinobacteria bacterium ATB1]